MPGKLTNKESEAARGWIRNGLLLSELPQIDKALEALDALCAEVEGLKAENAVMRELCEAADAIIFDDNCGVVPHDFFPSRRAYRVMKGCGDAR